jgi:hypothetical protein
VFGLIVDISELVRAAENIDTSWSNLKTQIAVETRRVQAVWQAAVYGMLLPGMTKPVFSDGYYASLTTPDAFQYPFNGDAFAGAVISTYPRAMMIEEGYASFDMKPGLLNGPKSRPKKDGGRYNIVPFRYLLPNKQYRNRHFPTMPVSIARLVTAKSFAPSIQDQPGGKVQWGSRLELPAGEYPGAIKNPFYTAAEAERRGKENPMTDVYAWKSSPFAGMVRIQKTYEQRKQSIYLTFRTVSDQSDPNSWIHPGQPPNPVVDAVANYVRKEVEDNLSAAAARDIGAQ